MARDSVNPVGEGDDPDLEGDSARCSVLLWAIQ
jgi:hypothetical protein